MRIHTSMIATVFLSLAGVATAQTVPAPTLTYVAPTGGQAGTTFEVTVFGGNLDKAEGLYFSFPGAKVEVVGESEKVVPKVDPKKPQPGMKPPPPRVSQKFKVTLPAKAPLGIQDVRVVTKAGVSNPRAFVVGDMKEFVEEEGNDDVPKAQKIELNSSVSGVISATTDVDYFQFSGKKGQRVVVSCLTSSIDSKLPVQVQFYSLAGHYLGFSRGYRHSDALIDAVLPDDGDYYVRLCSFTYTLGGPDYFYRLTVSTAPWIDVIYPPIVEAGKETKVTVLGRNLPKGVLDPALTFDGRPLEKVEIQVKAPADARAQQRLAYSGLVVPSATGLDGFELRLSNDSGASNPYLLHYARGSVVLDNEANDTLETAQKVEIPCEIAARLEKKGDKDYYAFTAEKGQVLSIEATGERLGSPLDLFFQVQDEKGKVLTEQDDNPESLSNQLLSRTDDPPRYRFVAPASGTYHVMVTSREAFTLAGPRHVYTLRITPEEPDFRLVAMPLSSQAPETVTVGQAGHQAYAVFVWRNGGFAGDIMLQGEELPPGVTMKPQVIAGNQKQAAFVVSAAADAAPAVASLRVVGSATINGKKTIREVRAATITWAVPQANTPTVTRLDRELVLATRGKAPYALQVEKDTITVLQGDKFTIPVKLVADPEFKAAVQVTAVSLPTGMAMPPLTLSPDKNALQASFDSKTTVLPGNYTVVLRGQTTVKPPPKPPGPGNVIETAPPVMVTVVPRQLAKLSAPAAAKLSAGKQTDLLVKVVREFDYTGDFKVQAVLPAGAKGLTIDAATIKAGEEEVKLVVRAEAGAPLAAVVLSVRATAMFNDTLPVVHETKVTVNVTK